MIKMKGWNSIMESKFKLTKEEKKEWGVLDKIQFWWIKIKMKCFYHEQLDKVGKKYILCNTLRPNVKNKIKKQKNMILYKISYYRGNSFYKINY